MQLQNYACGRWHTGRDRGVGMRDAASGEIVGNASSTGLDFAAMLSHARDVGGPALRALTFHERAALLKAVAKRLAELKEEFYSLSFRTGATRNDSAIDIEGGIGTVFAFAGKGSRELPNSRVYLDGAVEGLSKGGTFVGQHIYVSREGAAVHINAFNFPVWGMLEKFAPAILAGVPVIVKPATVTAYLAELVVRRIVESGLLPEGALQLVCGSLGDLFEHLNCQDTVSFTGSADTAGRLRVHPTLIRHAVRFVAETDSLNSSILAADAKPGTPEFDLFIKEVVREMTVKAGQKCTAIRRVLVPADRAASVTSALVAALSEVKVGNPENATVGMGPLVNAQQRKSVEGGIQSLSKEARTAYQSAKFMPVDADPQAGAFVPPTLFQVSDASKSPLVNELEVFGPVATVVPYRTKQDSFAIAQRGGGSPHRSAPT